MSGPERAWNWSASARGRAGGTDRGLGRQPAESCVAWGAGLSLPRRNATTRYLGAAIVKGDQRAIKEFEDRFAVLAEYGGAYVTIQDRLYSETKRLSMLRMKLEQAEADLRAAAPKFVVDQGPAVGQEGLSGALAGGGHPSTVAALLLAPADSSGQENIKKDPHHLWLRNCPS